MPASRSPNRGANAEPRSRSYWPLVAIGLAAVIAVSVAALPASMLTHFLPARVSAQDFSGSVWHGSAGKILVDAKDAGAIEWRLHPLALLGLTVAADLHWVKVGIVVDGSVSVDRRGFTAHEVTGSGPIDDLRDFGLAPGWHGSAALHLSELKGDLAKLSAAVGEVTVADIASAQVADGADLGSYELTLAPGAVDTEGNVAAQLVDTGGPLEVQALIRYTAKERTGTLSGTLRERQSAPAALRNQLDSLSQLRGRDAQGRIPADLEFRF